MEENIRWALTKANNIFTNTASATGTIFHPATSFFNEQLACIQTKRYEMMRAHHFSYRTLEMVGLSLGVFILSKGLVKRFRNTAIVGGIGGCIWTPELVNPWNRV